jgi:uncharacterized membrane protein
MKETGRVEAFSDGVFAIAITLLILDIKVPEPPDGFSALSSAEGTRWLLHELASRWASYVAYLMSFVVILVMWVSHHRIFKLVARVDGPFLFWNGLLLLLISFVPFPTSLAATYFLTPAAKVGAAVYAGHGVAISFTFEGLWGYATRRGKLMAPGTEETVARMTSRYRFGPWMYVVCFVVALFSATAALAMCLVFAAFFAFEGFFVAKTN